MPKILLSNPHSDTTLVVWIEPWGEDYWMRPGDALTVEFDDADLAEQAIDAGPFEVSWLDNGIVVWVVSRDGCTIRDRSGAKIECGHQRPDQADPATPVPESTGLQADGQGPAATPG
ncbi:hypothetical protein ACWF82_09975 [Nocardia sp. NPDC055053]